MPWDSWYEPNAALGGEKQIFASRFDAHAAQHVGARGPGPRVRRPLAEHPHQQGGREPVGRRRRDVPGNAPVPWVAWQEQDGNVSGSGNHDQIFVSKGVKQAAPKQPVHRLQAVATRPA